MDYEAVRMSTLMHWITEREKIRERKERGDPLPWTQDPILSAWRFCNVNRCDDRVTRWIFRHVIEAHKGHPSTWFNLAIARFINWPGTLAELGYFDEWDEGRFICIMGGIKGKAYTGAYMIPAGPSGVPKHVYLASDVFSRLWALRYQLSTMAATCGAWNTFYRQVPCMGDFLRNQIITDMKYSHHLRNAPDWGTFVLAGPGTQRGLNRLFGLSLTRTWKAPDSAHVLNELRWNIAAGYPHLTPLFTDLNNLSNCMCEFDKYCRVLSGEGTPRARYTPAPF